MISRVVCRASVNGGALKLIVYSDEVFGHGVFYRLYLGRRKVNKHDFEVFDVALNEFLMIVHKHACKIREEVTK